MRPNVTVEIGVWGGRSFLPLALAHKEIGKGIVIGIDPWSPSESVLGQRDVDAKWWMAADHELVRNDFLQKVQEYGVGDMIKIHRLTSDQFDITSVPTIDILHIDGNHSEQAFKDALKFAPNVRVGGLCFCDDLNWSGGGVLRAHAYLLESGFSELFRMDTGAMLQRIRA